MSGAPVVDVKGEVVAVHGMSGVEALKTFASLASLQASSSESGRSVDQDAQKRVEADVQPYIFSWGIPIRVLQDYRDRAIALDTEGQEVELAKNLSWSRTRVRRRRSEGRKKIKFL
jgi:hypothetical protein